MNEIREYIIRILKTSLDYVPYKPYKTTILKPKELKKLQKRADGSTKSNRKGDQSTSSS